MDVRRDPIAWARVALTVLLLIVAFAAGLDGLVVGGGSDVVPVPGILKGLDLGSGPGAVTLGEEDVVGGVGVEGRVEVDEIDKVRGKSGTAQDAQVVAVVEEVLGHGRLRCRAR